MVQFYLINNYSLSEFLALSVWMFKTQKGVASLKKVGVPIF